jgi:hypothetical protein
MALQSHRMWPLSRQPRPAAARLAAPAPPRPATGPPLALAVALQPAARRAGRAGGGVDTTTCRAAPSPGRSPNATQDGPVLEPTDRVLKLWRSCNAVCMDVDCESEHQSESLTTCLSFGRLRWRLAGGWRLAADLSSRLDSSSQSPSVSSSTSGTITVNDSLDLLAEFMGVGEEVARVTNKVRGRGSRGQ